MLRVSTKVFKKVPDRQGDLQIMKVAIVEKLKSYKGMAVVRKLLSLSQFMTKQAGQIQENPLHLSSMILMLEGSIEVHKRNHKSPTDPIILTKEDYEYIFIDSNTERLVFLKNSSYYLLDEKYVFQIFEGVMSFPSIENRLQRLRKNVVFNTMEKRDLIKISFQLQEIRLRIGNIIECNSFPLNKMKRNRAATEANRSQSQSEEQNQQERQSVKQTPKNNPTFCYFIVQGEVEAFQGKNKPVCLLGEREIFSNFTKIDRYYGKVSSEVALVYKINEELIPKHIKSTEYENKRAKWRTSRLRDISKVFQRQKSKIKVQSQIRASFLDKQKAFKTFYGHTGQHIDRLKMTCKVADFTCQNRQQFYSKKLDRILALQKIRYGEMETKTVLFPMPINKTLQNLQNSRKMHESEKVSKSNTIYSETQNSPKKKEKKRNSRRLTTQPASKGRKGFSASFFATGTL